EGRGQDRLFIGRDIGGGRMTRLDETASQDADLVLEVFKALVDGFELTAERGELVVALGEEFLFLLSLIDELKRRGEILLETGVLPDQGFGGLLRPRGHGAAGVDGRGLPGEQRPGQAGERAGEERLRAEPPRKPREQRLGTR